MNATLAEDATNWSRRDPRMIGTRP